MDGKLTEQQDEELFNELIQIGDECFRLKKKNNF
jgi:hypothetical protein